MPWQLAGNAVTDKAGVYSVTVTSPSALTSSADPWGYVNLEVTTGPSWWGFSRRIAGSGTMLAMASPDMSAITRRRPSLRP